MKKKYLLCVFVLLVCVSVHAQRKTDALSRGLVVVPTSSPSGTLVSWRRLANEYYDVTYNLYRDGTMIAANLTTTSYEDSDSGDGSYQVAAVVKGVVQPSCEARKAWMQYGQTGYLDITLAAVYDRTGRNVTTDYEPNDAEMADLDGDGELDLIIKRLNTADAGGDANGNVYPASSKAFVVFDAYKVNWQTGAATLLWRIDCGPNMVSLNSTEVNLIAYDWDEDGKAEVVLRGADDMIIHANDGTTETIGIAGWNFRNSANFDHKDGWQYAWTHFGREYLVYLDGLTGKTYQVMDYPLPRLEQSEWSKLSVSVPYNDYVALENAGYGNYFTKSSGVLAKAWGDNYGHRSTKHFFGAPVLDGRKASLFLGRGIYTRHKMVTMNLNRENHQWSTNWTWACNNSNSPWYGNGYHNFVIADVDEDGRDEIVYGSMVIDDDGHGLSTTGYQHGDAQHVTDFNPWRKGLEFFGCLEDGPYYGCNYRDATTSEVLYKFNATGDDGRALMANFSNSYPGSLGRSSGSPGMMSAVRNELVPEMSGDSYVTWSNLNFRIYWDGDLCSEILNSSGTAKEAIVEKPGVGRLFTSDGGNMNNDSKNNPCFQGDIIGDWREEIVIRQGQNVRVYTTGTKTSHSMPSLWFDHEYRQAMVWQMMAYNQPPHLSYFLGEMEGYTQAPPPLTNADRVEVTSGKTIGSNYNDQHVMACTASNMTITVADGVSPAVFTDNAPSWVQGTDVNGTSAQKVKIDGDGTVGATNLPVIKRTYYTHTLTGGGFAGDMHLCKQGDGTLILPDVDQTYTGGTTVWAGTLQFNGQMPNSAVSMKRFTTLNSNGGTFGESISMEYGATLNVGGAVTGSMGRVTTTTLNLGYGSRVVMDVNGNGDNEHDWLNATTLVLDTDKASNSKWQAYGPELLVPVIELHIGQALEPGLYPLGNVQTISGDLSRVIIDSNDIMLVTCSLVHVDGKLCLKVSDDPEVTEVNIEPTGMNLIGDHYYPYVTISSVNTDGLEPTLSGTFTAADGTVTELDAEKTKSLYSENYESVSSIDGWTTSGANISLGTGDATYGKYFYVNTGGTNTRYAYKTIGGLDMTEDEYVVEFDLALAPCTKDNEAVEFCVMAEGGTMPTNNWDNYATINDGKNLLFDLTGGTAKSTAYTVNGTETTTTLAKNTWYHYTLVVNQTERTVKWTISNGDGGTYTLPAGTSTHFNGFYLVAARYNSEVRLDNITVTAMLPGLRTFTFTEPGTLAITAAIDGYLPTTTTFEVAEPYIKTYESTDYSTIAAADASLLLGTMWNAATTTGRPSGWSSENPTYGSKYVLVRNNLNTSETQPIWLDNEQVLWGDFVGGSVAFAYMLVQDFGIVVNNKQPTYHANGFGDGDSWVLVRSDLTKGVGGAATTVMVHPDSDGMFSYLMPLSGALQQVTVFKPLSKANEGMSTDIITQTPLTTGDDAVFDLSGRKVANSGKASSSLKKGVYIVGGKKIVK